MLDPRLQRVYKVACCDRLRPWKEKEASSHAERLLKNSFSRLDRNPTRVGNYRSE